MIRETAQTNDLTTKMRERTAVLLKMKSRHLDFKWLQEFGLQQLMDSCDRIAACLPTASVFRDAFQRELIQNPNFAAYLAKLLPMFPEEPPKESNPAPAYIGGYRHVNRYSYAPAKYTPPSRRAVLMSRLNDLLELCRENQLDITSSPADKVMSVLECEQSDTEARLVYLTNFLSEQLSEEEQQAIISGLSICVSLPIHLDGWQKELLRAPYIATQTLFKKAEFEDICRFLRTYPEVTTIITFLHEREICEHLELADYNDFISDTAERRALLAAIADRLGPDNTSEFIYFWKNSKYAIDELRRMHRQITTSTSQDWASVFSNYSGYVNLLYGSRFKSIDLTEIQSYQEDILTYAIVHNKKHFIKLVDEKAEQFLSLPRDALLLQESLYREHFNLNELTEKNLDACRWMRSSSFDVSCLVPGRKYTFPELAALYNAPAICIALYHLLQSDSQDYRLRVLRQLCKRNVLKSYMEPNLPQLADKLNIKPLQAWKEQEFGHIAGLSLEEAAELLIHFSEICHLLPSIHCRTEAILALRNLASLPQIDTIDSLKANIASVDSEWHTLAEEMALSKEFLAAHQESILNFICENGAYIARTYANNLDEVQREAFYRVVKAELMGQLHTLKYFEGDLQRELDAPLTERVKAGWSKNKMLSEAGMDVREYDDFFSTMCLGIQPQRTCLSYIDGAYNQCLLSAFDSNKKVLYVSLDGRIVGRAFLRLTKGRLTGSTAKGGDSDFNFVDLEDIAASRHMKSSELEELTLFLERPYISGVGPEQEKQVYELLIELACAKADDLGTTLVLSRDYHPVKKNFTQTLFDIYISKSKAGEQYLDSLDGPASVSAEGSYKANSFLVRVYRPFQKT